MLTRYVLPLIALATLVFAITQMTKAQQKPPAVSPPIEPGKSPFVRQVAGAGIIESETENIAIGSHVPGVVEKVFVRVGQTVRPSDRLFQLDDRALRADVAVRKANLLNARASADKLEMTPRKEERPGNEAKILEADVNLKDQTLAYERLRKLTDSSAVSDDELTRKQMAVELAKATLSRVKGDFKLWEAGAWEPDRQIARSVVEQAQVQLSQAETEVARLTAKAPQARWKQNADGSENADDEGVQYKVLQVNIRPGEYVGNTPNSPLIVLGFVGKLHVRVDLDENDIARFRPDLVGVAKPRGNPNIEFPLSFVRVDPYVIPKRSLTGANTERVDTRVLQVIYAIDTKGQPLYVGQQVDVFLNAGSK